MGTATNIGKSSRRTRSCSAVLIAIMVSFGGLAEIIPLFNDAQTVKPAPGVTPYEPLRLAGRDVYVREGCYQCHSQMIRTLSFETQRYGDRSDAGEFVYDRPFQWGSKRTGPDLARVGGKYSDAWQRAHLLAPRELVPQIEHARLSVAGGSEDRRRRPAGHACARCARSAIRTRDAQIAGAADAVHGQDRARCAGRLSTGTRRETACRPLPR